MGNLILAGARGAGVGVKLGYEPTVPPGTCNYAMPIDSVFNRYLWLVNFLSRNGAPPPPPPLPPLFVRSAKTQHSSKTNNYGHRQVSHGHSTVTYIVLLGQCAADLAPRIIRICKTVCHSELWPPDVAMVTL